MDAKLLVHIYGATACVMACAAALVGIVALASCERLHRRLAAVEERSGFAYDGVWSHARRLRAIEERVGGVDEAAQEMER